MVLVFILVGSSYATEQKTVTIDTTKVTNLLKKLIGKTLKKDETIKFLNDYAITIEDERGNGVVTYIFDEQNYKRYKDFKVISDDAWRFTNTGQLRLFNTDIKLTWKIKLDKENTINIKAKYAPIGKLYSFTYELKADYLAKVEDFYNKEIAEKERLEQEKLDAQKKAEEEKLDAQKKAEEEKERLEQEKLEVQQKAEEEKERLEQEKLEVQQKAEEEKKRLEQEKLEAQQKSEGEKKKLEEEKLKLQKELEEQRKILEEEKLYHELEPKFRRKCKKQMLNDLYEIGTPEYRECILNKGPEKQLQQEKLDAQQKSEKEKERLEQEKLEVQQKTEEEKERLEQEKLEAQKKAEEESIDIRDFEIEGMSIGDSALDFFTEDEIKNNIGEPYPNSDKFYMVEIEVSSGGYQVVTFHVKSNDKKYRIYALSALKFFPIEIEGCYELKDKMSEEYDKLFFNIEKKSYKKKHSADKTGKSTIEGVSFNFEHVDYGDYISIACYDWSKKMEDEMNFADNLRVDFITYGFRNWLNQEAF